MLVALFVVSALIAVGGILVFIEKLDLGMATRTVRDICKLPWSDEFLGDFGRFCGLVIALLGVIFCVTVALGKV